MAENLDLKPGIFPAFVIHNILNDEVYPYDQREEITGVKIDEFINDVAQGKQKPGPKFGQNPNVSGDDEITDEDRMESDGAGMSDSESTDMHDEL
jgi:hypothetical protein